MRTDIEPEGIPTALPLAAIRIETVDDYEAATARVAELSGAPEDSPGERELVALVDAIEAWDLAHDDATAWR